MAKKQKPTLNNSVLPQSSVSPKLTYHYLWCDAERLNELVALLDNPELFNIASSISTGSSNGNLIYTLKNGEEIYFDDGEFSSFCTIAKIEKALEKRFFARHFKSKLEGK